MIEFLKAFLFGIVEGITEWLPISSTGHMILLNEFVKLDVSDEFYSMFEVVIQLGAIMAVVILFWNDIFPFGKPEWPSQKTFCAWDQKIHKARHFSAVGEDFGGVCSGSDCWNSVQ